MTIYSLVDNGRLHISVSQGDQPALYQGSINSYNNFFTKIIFGTFLGTTIKLDGKLKCVNKSDYLNFLNSFEATEEIKKGKLTEFTIEDLTLKTNLKIVLTDRKVQEINKRLVLSLLAKNKEMVKESLAMGADVNCEFWIYGKNNKMTLDDFETTLFRVNYNSIQVKFYTPLIYSVENGSTELTEILKKYQADRTIVGKSFKYIRTIKPDMQLRDYSEEEKYLYLDKDYELQQLDQFSLCLLMRLQELASQQETKDRQSV